MSNDIFEVEVKASAAEYIDEDDYNGEWTLEFKFMNSHATYSFLSEEPYMKTYGQWASLTEAGNYVYLYNGNGQGSIHNNADRLEFVSNTSGAGGDTCSKFVIDANLVNDKLLGALEVARESGFKFAKPKKCLAVTTE